MIDPKLYDVNQVPKKKLRLDVRTTSALEAQQALSQFVDSMDLDEALLTPDGPDEAYKPKEVFHPAYQRLKAWLYHRAFYPDDEVLPDAPTVVLQSISPLPDVIKKSGPYVSEIVNSFDIKKGKFIDYLKIVC